MNKIVLFLQLCSCAILARMSESVQIDATEAEKPYHITDVEIRDVIEAVRAEDADTVNTILSGMDCADIAETIAKIPEEERDALIKNYSESLEPETYTEMDQELSKQCLSQMPVTEVAEILTDLQSDDALNLIENLDDTFQADIIDQLSGKTRMALEEGLTFPEDSAGRLMRREVVAVPESWSVGKTIDYLRDSCEDLPEDFFDIFVITPSYKIAGEIPLSRVITAKRSVKLEDLKLEETHPIPANMDQEEVAQIFRRNDRVSAPVVDENNRLLGVITIDDVVDVIDEEAQEDILRLAGVDHGDLYRAVLSTTGTRFRWLFVNLITAVLASVVISLFDATIEQIVALAILMPIVASMGGNAGTQALTVAVRALSTREISESNTWRIIWKETLVGTLNGIAFAILIAILAALWFGSWLLGVVIALAMVINLIVAGTFGAGIPIFLNKTGSDPAVSSTVLLTTITDVVGFLAFLGLASIFLL